jgi:hypothetical protein
MLSTNPKRKCGGSRIFIEQEAEKEEKLMCLLEKGGRGI